MIQYPDHHLARSGQLEFRTPIPKGDVDARLQDIRKYADSLNEMKNCLKEPKAPSTTQIVMCPLPPSGSQAKHSDAKSRCQTERQTASQPNITTGWHGPLNDL